MRIRKSIVTIALIAGFCGYLIGTSCTSGRPNEGSSLQKPLLLSQATRVTQPDAESVPTTGTTLGDETETDAELPMPPLPTAHTLAAVVTATSNTASSPAIVKPPKGNYRTVWAIVTGYCPCWRCCGRHANGITSTGTSAWTRGVAADPKALSYGTKVYVPGYGYSAVDDTGGAMRRVWRTKGMVHLDLRMTYHWQAKQWGRKVLKIRVYDVD